MQTTLHRAFGIVVSRTLFVKDEVVVLDPIINNVFQVGPSFSFVWYNTAGDDLLVNTVTGEQLARPVGTCTLTTPIPYGEWRMQIPEDMEVLCVSPFMNANMLPLSAHMVEFKLLSGAQTVIPHGTKLFLGSGKLTVESKTIEGPNQILFKSGDKTVTASTNCYGFIIV
jgi:hypothetical protein